MARRKVRHKPKGTQPDARPGAAQAKPEPEDLDDSLESAADEPDDSAPQAAASVAVPASAPSPASAPAPVAPVAAESPKSAAPLDATASPQASQAPPQVAAAPAPKRAEVVPAGEEGTYKDDEDAANGGGPAARQLPKRARSIKAVRGTAGGNGGVDADSRALRGPRPGREAQRPRFQLEEPTEAEDDRSLPERLKDILYSNITGPRKPSAEVMAHYSRKLSSLISAGIPLVRALRLLAERSTSNRDLKSASFDVARDVERGMSLSEAFEKHPEMFDRLFVGVVKTGETGGILEEALRRLSEILERRAALRKRVKNALVYPVVLIILAIVVVAIIMIYIVPVFRDFFDQAGSDLPTPTLVVMGISDHLVNWWAVWLVALVGGVFGLRYLINTRPEWRRIYEHIRLRVPRMGALNRMVNTAHMARTVGNLLAAGIPLWECLTVTARTSESLLMREDIDAACTAVEEGRKLEASLRKSPCFTNEFVDVVGIGEEAGMLERLMLQLANDYEEDIRMQLEGLLELLKPALLIVLALIVVMILLAVYLPYFRMISAVGA